MSFSTKERKRVAIDFKNDRGLTEQSHKDACDIHNILRRAQKTGVLEHVNAYKGTYGTMPTGDQYHAQQNAIARANTMFETIPSKIRKKFDNDPAKFLDYVTKDENYAEMQEMGFDVSHLKEPEKPAPKADPKLDPKPVEKVAE